MQSIGFLGGTGDLGKALAVNVLQSYEKVMIGSRSLERAHSVLKEISAAKKDLRFRDRLLATTNADVAGNADIIVATLPYESAVDTFAMLSTKFRGNQLLISAVAPIAKVGNEFRPIRSETGKSISVQIKEILRDRMEVATAFQTVPARILFEQKIMDADVLVCADEQTYPKVAEVVNHIEGLRPLHVGGLDLSQEIEGLTSILLNLAVRNHLKSPTFRINSF